MTAVRATFSDFKTVKTRSVAQLVFEVPLEEADAVLAALGGVPVPNREQWVGVAPITEQAAARPPLQSKAQIAGKLCAGQNFKRYCEELGSNSPEEYIRSYCDIDSRKELDTDDVAAARFQEIRDNFSAWCRVSL